MADPEQLAILKRGVDEWNAWRHHYPAEKPNLTEAELSSAGLTNVDLIGANLTRADLSKANLRSAELGDANLYAVNLRAADLGGARLGRMYMAQPSAVVLNTNTIEYLAGADLSDGDLRDANLCNADLTGTNLTGANLSKANLTNVDLLETVFADTDLTSAKGLESCHHLGPSTIDHRTLAKSGPLPLAFLRGVGLPDRMIEYLPSLAGEAIQFYACFISYSSKDQAFAERLHADLQDKGVRCWFAPHDLPIGAETRTAIDEAIRRYDKLLLVLSEHSVRSNWVKKEVETAFEREDRSHQLVLFPVRLDNAVFQIESGWAADIRRLRNIGDMRQWKDHDTYQRLLDRLLRDLRTDGTAPASDHADPTAG